MVMEVGKQDFSMQIWAFHLIPGKTIPETDPLYPHGSLVKISFPLISENFIHSLAKKNWGGIDLENMTFLCKSVHFI